MDLDIERPFRGSLAVRSGELTRGVLTGPTFRTIGFDTFVASHVADSPLLGVMALLVRGGAAAVATGWSACVVHGLDVASRPVPIEITAPGRRLAHHPGTVVWQYRVPPREAESEARSGVRTTTCLRTCFDLACRTVARTPGHRVEPLVGVVAACDALARRGGFTGADLASFAERHPGARGVSGAVTVAGLLDPGAASPPESRARMAMLAAGLPRPVLQFEVASGGPRPWQLDLAWPEFKVALEYDGKDHALSDRRGRDIDRLDALRRDGWLVIVVTARQLARPSWAPDRVREALIRRGWKPAVATGCRER